MVSYPGAPELRIKAYLIGNPTTPDKARQRPYTPIAWIYFSVSELTGMPSCVLPSILFVP